VAVVLALVVFWTVWVVVDGNPTKRTLSRLKRLRSPVLEAAIGQSGSAAAGAAKFTALTRLLRRSDSRFTAKEVLMAAAAVSVLMALVLSLLIGPLAVVVGPALTIGGGRWWLAMRTQKRQREMEAALPSLLQAVANGLRAGHALGQSLEMAAGQESSPLSREVQSAVSQMRLGLPLEDVLEELAADLDLTELSLAVTAISVQRQVGGNLAEVLDRIQGTLRERLRIANEVRALTAQGRMSGWIVSLLPVAIAVLTSLIDPGFLHPLFATTIGHIMLGAAVLLELVGGLVIRQLVQVNY
jgi:tight adherence protein B